VNDLFTSIFKIAPTINQNSFAIYSKSMTI
jgi:hypothetical protein